MNVAVNARIRQYVELKDGEHSSRAIERLTKAAADPRMGYVLGRMFLAGHLTREQHKAGVSFGEDLARYYGLTGVSFPSARAQNLFAVAGEAGESDSRAEAAARASAKAKRLSGLLLASGSMQEGRDTLRIVQMVAVQDQHIGKSTRALFLLRRGLNVLHRHYQG